MKYGYFDTLIFDDPANDDKPTHTWLEFAGSPAYEWGLKHGLKELISAIKHRWNPDDLGERSQENFIWLIRFEYSWYKENKQPTLEIVK